MLNGEKRGLPARRAMTFLGKIPAAPKPINLPSQRLENRGLDLNVEIVPKGTLTWATTGRSPPTAGSPWGNAGSPPVPTGAWGKSPTVGGHISSRPSSAETRPSSAGSMRHNNNQEQPVIASAWGGTSSRPSSASGVLGQSQSQAPPSRGGRPQSAEPRPGSAQSSSLSRFVASNEPSRNQAWANSATSLKSLEEPRQHTGFALSSVNFPSLGSEKNSDLRPQQSDKAASPLPGVNEKQEEEGAVDTWRKPQYQSMELWNEDSSIAPPPHAFPSPVPDSWHRGMHASQASGGSVAKDAWRRDPSSGVIPHVGMGPLPHDAFLHRPMDSEAIAYGSGGGGYVQGGGYRPPVDMYNNVVPYLRHRAPVSGHPAHPMGPPMYLDHPMQQYDGYYGGPRGGHPPVNMHERERMMVAGPEMHANICPGPPPEHLHWHGQGPLPPNPRMHPEPASKYVAFDDNFEGVKCSNSAVEPKNARGFDVKDSSKREARRQDPSKNEVKIVLLSSSERGGNANRIPGKPISEVASAKEEVNSSRSALARDVLSLPLSSMDQVTSAKEDTGGVDKAAHPPSFNVPNTIMKKVGFAVEQAVQSQTLHGSQTQEAGFLIKNNSSHRVEKGRNETPSKILNKVIQEQPKEKPQAGSTINDMAKNSELAKVSKPTRNFKMEDTVAEQTLTNQSREMASSGTKPAKVKKEREPSLKVSSAEGPVSGQGHLSANKETASVKPLNALILSGEAVDSSCLDMSTEGSSTINSHSKSNVKKNNEKHDTSKSEAPVSNSVSLVEKSIPTETGKAAIVPEEHSAEYRQKQKHGAREGEKEWRRKTDLAELKPEASKSSRSTAGDDSQLAKLTAMASATSVQEVKRNSEPLLSHCDVSQQPEPYDYKAQREKLKAVATQRAQQLQKEEEERVKEQKAKAAVKLEELNRRTMQSSSLVEVVDLTAGGEAAKVAVSSEETSATLIHSQSDDGNNRRAQKKPDRDLTTEKEMFKGKMKSSLKVPRMDNTGEEIHPSQDVPSKPDLAESTSSLSPGPQQFPSRTQHTRHKNKQGILKPLATTEDASLAAPALVGTKDTVVADGPSSDVTNVEPAALLKKKKSSRGGRNRTKPDVILSTDFSSNSAYSGEISSSNVHGPNMESSTDGGSAVHSFETQSIELSKDGKPRGAHGPLEMQGTQSGVFDESSSGKKVQRKPQIQRRFKERGAAEVRSDNPTTADGLTWAPVRTEPCQSVDCSEGNIEIQAESRGGIREDVKDRSKNPAILGEHPALPWQQGNSVCPSESARPSQQEMESSAVEARPRSIESSRVARHHPLSWRQKQGDRHTVKQGEEQSPAEQGDNVAKMNVVEASIPSHGEGRKRTDRQSEGASPVYRANIPRNNNGGTLQPRLADPLPEARQPKRAYNAELRHQPKSAMDSVSISSEHGPVSSTVQDVAASRKEPKKEPEIDVSLQSGRAAQWKISKQPKQLENDYQEPRRYVAIGESNTMPPLRFERRNFQEEDAPPQPPPPAVRPPHSQPRFKPPRERSTDMIASEQPPHLPNTNSGEEKFPIRQKQQRAQVDGQTGNRNERHSAHKSERESHITSLPPGGIAANDENKSAPSAAGMSPQSTLPPNSSRQQQHGYSRDPAKEIVGNMAPPPAYQPKKGHSSSHFQWQQASSGWSDKPKATSGRQALKAADVPMNEDSKQKHLEPSGGYIGGIPSNVNKSQTLNPSFGGQDYRQAPDFHQGRKPEGGGGGRSNNQHYGGAGGGAPQGEQMENSSFRPRNSGFGRRGNSGGGGRPYVRREPDMEHRHVNQPNAISGSSSGRIMS